MLAVVAFGCDGLTIPSQRAIYKIAYQALKSQPDFPSGAKIHPRAKAVISVGKNAAWVDLAYDRVNAAGETETLHYRVRLKRVARTWQVEQIAPTL